MFTFVAPLSKKEASRLEQLDYHSVEFKVNDRFPVYHFKLWRSESNTMFLLAKENSGVATQLKVGHVLPMKYYDACTVGRTEIHDTRIRQIVNEDHGRFQGHCRIEITMIERKRKSTRIH